MQTLTPLKVINDLLHKAYLCVVAVAVSSCGGGGADSNGDNDPRGSAPDVAGWSTANVLTAQQTSSFAYFHPIATLDNSGTAIVSSDGIRPGLAMFQSSAVSAPWSAVPDLPFTPFTYTPNRFGHFLVNGRLNVVIESETPESIVEAAYQNGWSTQTIAAPQNPSNHLAIAQVLAGASGQRAVMWFEYGAQGTPTTDYFSAVPLGSASWDPISVLPQGAAYTSDDARRFLASGAFIIVASNNTPYGSNLYGYLYENGSWSAPALLIPSALPNKVGCAAIAALDSHRYALAWLEETPVSGPPAYELQYTARFALFDGSSPLTVTHDVFLPAAASTFSSINSPACPKIHATANGELTLVWHRGTEMLARRFVNGSFTGNPVSLQVPTVSPSNLIGAFDGVGNFRFVLSSNNQLLTSAYKVDQGVWSALASIWNGATDIYAHSFATNSRGDAIVTWIASDGPAPPRTANVSLMARRFTQ
jgi:hypothetical protein